MLESLGLGEATSPESADVIVFNTCTVREKPDTRLAAYLGNAAAQKRERPDLVIAIGGCYAEAQRERIFERYPFVDVAFGPGSIPHLGDWIATGGYAVPRGKFGTHEHFAAELPAPSRAPLPGLGAGLDGLQLGLRLLHRPRGPGPRAEPAAGRDRGRSHGTRARRRQGDHAPRPERQLVGARPRAVAPHRLRRAPPGLRRGRRDRADPLHEPASEGLPRACHCCHCRVPERLRAGAPPAPVGLLRRPQAHAPYL